VRGSNFFDGWPKYCIKGVGHRKVCFLLREMGWQMLVIDDEDEMRRCLGGRRSIVRENE